MPLAGAQHLGGRRDPGLLGRVAALLPEGPDPDGEIEVAALKFHPDLRAHRRHGEKALVGQSAAGQAGQGPAAFRLPQEAGHPQLQPGQLFRVNALSTTKPRYLPVRGVD